MTRDATDAPDTPQSIEGYAVVRELGRGAMGVVYLARDRLLERDVAIKVLHEAEHGSDAAERFLREARATARLSHPNVVTVYRAGLAHDGPYLVMELLRGRSLETAIADDGPLPPARLMEVALDAARGLAAAHARGIVHRDVKPSNLFETDERVVKVVDFGIAKLMAQPVARAVAAVAAAGETTRPDGRATEPDASVARDVDELGATRPAEASRDSGERTQIGGTPLFMAPEVWREEGTDHASDVWSLGATLYTLATGFAPFNGRTIPEIAYRVMIATPAESLAVKRPDLSAAFCAAVDRALAKSRARRFASAGELLTELERLARDARGPRAIVGSPYPGLRSMTGEDRERFFGRSEDVTRVLERLRSEPLVVLVGPSGAGKSSLAAAGVAPDVADGALGGFDRWRIVRVAPGRAPVSVLAGAITSSLGAGDGPDALAQDLLAHPDALARALREHVARTREGVLLLIDQLEELVTLSQDDEREAAAAALGRLVDLAPAGVRVLATARSDLFDRLGALGSLGAVLGRAIELVRPLSGASLREALVEPARSVGARFDDETLIDRVLDEAGTGDGALPLVAFAMRAWWDGRDRTANVLTRAAWERVGGVAGALGAHAEQVYAQLAPDDRAIARAVFLQLVATDGTRRYATHGELSRAAGSDGTGLDRVLVAFVRARLVLAEGAGDTSLVTVAHEALGRAWPRLMAWQTEGREDRALHERLHAATRAWQAASEPADLLWRGALLQQLDHWREVYDDTLDASERRFADISLRLSRTTRRRRLALLASGVLVLGGVAVIATVAAMRARTEASRLDDALHTQTSRAERDRRERNATVSAALRDVDPSRALAWLAADGVVPTRAMRIAALALEARGVAVRFACNATPALRDDGSRVACGDDAGLQVIDVDTGGVRQIARGEPVRHVALAERADRVAWIDDTGVLSVRDETGARRRMDTRVGGRPLLAMDAEGTSVAVLERTTHRLLVADVATGTTRVLATGVLPDHAMTGATLVHAGGGVLITEADEAGTTTLLRYDATTVAPPTHVLHARFVARAGTQLAYREEGARVQVVDLATGAGTCAFDAAGMRSIAIAALDGRIAWLARTPTGDELGVVAPPCTVTRRTLPRTDGDAVAFVPHAAGVTTAVVAHDGPLVLYDPADPADPGTVIGETGETLSRDVQVMATGPDLALVLDRATGRAAWRGVPRWLAAPGANGVALVAAAIDPRGRRTVVVDAAHGLRIHGPPPSMRLEHAHWPAAMVARDATGRLHVTALSDGRVGIAAAHVGIAVLDVAADRVVWEAARPDAVAVALNGSSGLMAFADGRAERVDLDSGARTPGELLADGAAPAQVAISRDGARVAAVARDGTLSLRRTDADPWTVLPLREFGELRHASALALSSRAMAAAGARLGLVGPSFVTTLADAPGDFYEHPMTVARFASDGALLLAGDDGAAWLARCDDSSCTTRRASMPALARAIAPVGDDAFVSVARGAALMLHDRTRGPMGAVLSADAMPDADAVDLDDDALVLAGDVQHGSLVRLALPPADSLGFARWIASRTNERPGHDAAAHPAPGPPPPSLP